jgi:O-antigen ligase
MLAIAVIPAAVVVHVALPGTIGAFREAFFPEGGLVANQSTSVGQAGQGRVADLGPALDAFAQRPLFGQGFATRPTASGAEPAETIDPLTASLDGQILDNQWLGMLLETGILGVAALLWLVLAASVAFGKKARHRSDTRGLMLLSIAASVSAFGVGMFFFDAFAFVQVTLLFFVLLALGASAVLLDNGRASPGEDGSTGGIGQ